MPKKVIFTKDEYFKMLDKMLTLPELQQPTLIERLKQSLLKRQKKV